MTLDRQRQLAGLINEYIHEPLVKIKPENLKKIDRFCDELNKLIVKRLEDWAEKTNRSLPKSDIRDLSVQYKPNARENVEGFLTIAETNETVGQIYCYIDKSTMEVYDITDNQTLGRDVGDLDQNIIAVAKKVHDLFVERKHQTSKIRV